MTTAAKYLTVIDCLLYFSENVVVVVHEKVQGDRHQLREIETAGVNAR